MAQVRIGDRTVRIGDDDYSPSVAEIEEVASSLEITGPQEKTSLPEKVGQFVGNVRDQLVEGPGRDFASGLLQGNIAVSKPSASVLEFMNVPDKFNLPKQSISANQSLLDNLPEAKSPQPARFINELMGQAPGVTAEFLQGGAALKGVGAIPGVGKMASKLGSFQGVKQSAELATTRALEELNEGFPEVIQAAQEGAMVGLAFPIAQKGFGLLKQGFKDGAKKLIQTTTNNARLAEDFVNNPFRYSLRFLDKNIKTVKDARSHNNVLEQKLVDAQKVETQTFQSSQRRVKEEATIKQKDALDALSNKSNEVATRLKKEGAEKLDQVRTEAGTKLQEHRVAVGENLNSRLTGVFDRANLVRKQEGELVGDAIEGIVAINPSAHIPVNTIYKGINPILREGQKKGFFKVGKDGLEAISSGQAGNVNRINRFLGDLKNVESGKAPLELLQAMKNDARQIAEQAFSRGNNQLGVIMSNLSSALNPAKIVSGNPALSKTLGTLAEANARFAKQIKPYNDLSKLMTSVDGNGNVVVEPSKILNAVKNNDIAIINRLRKIDSALPKEDRILPILKDNISQAEKAVVQQKAIVKQTKRSIEDAEKALSDRMKNLHKNMVKNQRSERFKFSEEQKNAMSNRMRQDQEKLRAFKKEAEDEINFLEDQDAIRSFLGHGLTGLVQRVFSFGSLFPAATTAISGVGSVGALGGTAAALIPVLGLSPNIIGKTVQTAARADSVVSTAVGEIKKRGGERLLQRFLAKESD